MGRYSTLRGKKRISGQLLEFSMEILLDSHAGGTISISGDAKTQPYEGGKQNVESKHEGLRSLLFLLLCSFPNSPYILLLFIATNMHATHCATKYDSSRSLLNCVL